VDFLVDGALSNIYGGAKHTKDASPMPENDLAKANCQKALESPAPNTDKPHIINPIVIKCKGCTVCE
jgi:hypothetical protein